MTNAPHISVIIPSKNDHERLALCLAALQAQTLDRDAFEVIVADNGSAPSLEALAREHGARYVLQPEGGSYAARNAALEIAKGGVLAFTDSDCLPAADWLECGLAATNGQGRVGKPDLVAGRVEVFAQDANAPTAAEVYEMLFAFPQRAYVEHDSFGVTANLFVRRQVIDHAGPFSDGLHSGGDREFGRRAAAAGFGLVYEPQVVVRHPARRTIEQLYRKLDRVIGGLADSELAGPKGAAEARRRAQRALRPPMGQWRRVWRDGPAGNPKARLSACVLIARLRLRTAMTYRQLARTLEGPAQNENAGGPTPPPPPEAASSAG